MINQKTIQLTHLVVTGEAGVAPDMIELCFDHAFIEFIESTKHGTSRLLLGEVQWTPYMFSVEPHIRGRGLQEYQRIGSTGQLYDRMESLTEQGVASVIKDAEGARFDLIFQSNDLRVQVLLPDVTCLRNLFASDSSLAVPTSLDSEKINDVTKIYVEFSLSNSASSDAEQGLEAALSNLVSSGGDLQNFAIIDKPSVLCVKDGDEFYMYASQSVDFNEVDCHDFSCDIESLPIEFNGLAIDKNLRLQRPEAL